MTAAKIKLIRFCDSENFKYFYIFIRVIVVDKDGAKEECVGKYLPPLRQFFWLIMFTTNFTITENTNPCQHFYSSAIKSKK